MSGTLPVFIERWLGLETKPGEAVSWSLNLNWPWPPWATLLFMGLAAAFVVGIYLREGRLAGRRYRLMLAFVRLTLVIIVMLMIAQATLLLKRTCLPNLALLIDDSLSMTIADRYDDKIHELLLARIKRLNPNETEITRWNLVRTLLCEHNAALLRKLSEKYKLYVYFLTSMRSSPHADAAGLAEEINALRPSGESSRIGAAINAIMDDLRGNMPVAIVMLSDGVNSAGPSPSEAAANAQRHGIPLLCVGLGGGPAGRELKVSDFLVDEVVYVDDVVQFECKLIATGMQGSKATVELREKDKPQALAQTEVTLGSDDQPQIVRLLYRPTQPGRFQYAMETRTQGGPQPMESSSPWRMVEVREEKLRVLLAQARPSFEFRYLRNVLERDKSIELSTVLQEADLEHAQQDKAALATFPERRDELFSYDVIILGDLNPALLSASALQNLAAYVDRPGKGGALVLIAGPLYMPLAYRNTPLERLLPVGLAGLRLPDPNEAITAGFVLRPTELGLATPAMQLGNTPAQTETIWQNFPRLYWFVEAPELNPGARVWAEHPDRTASDGRRLPLIIMQYVGAGRVLFQATDETWRWRWRVGDMFFARYWIQTLRFLSRSGLAQGGNVTLISDRQEYTEGEAVRLRACFADERLAPGANENAIVAVELPGQQSRRLQLRRAATGQGIFEGVLDQTLPGNYHAWLVAPSVEGQTPSVDFIVAAAPNELAALRPDASAMRQAAKQSGGHYYDFLNAGKMLSDLPASRPRHFETLPPMPLWNKWPVLLLFLMLLSGEWLLRKRKGMA